MVKITEGLKAEARRQAQSRCECEGVNCRHHRRGSRCKRGLREGQWKVYWRTEDGGAARENIEAWCLDCFANNFTVPTVTVTLVRSSICGYRELVEVDQRKALTLMSVLRDAAEGVAGTRKGTALKAVTDEVWLEFDESPPAVDAAVELQPRFHERAQRLNLPTPEICSGIHRGDVTRSRTGDRFGEAITVASLVRGLAQGGQIVVSSTVVDQLDRRFELEDLGTRSFEDLAEPLSCWALRP